MLLTITNTRHPATHLGYLLAKHPERVQSFDLSFGKAHVFYPEAAPDCCTAALLLDVDPVGLVRGPASGFGTRGGGPLANYVNDRPYVASSFLSVALAEVYRSALGGRCREHPELAEERLPLSAHLPVLPCRGGEGFLRQLFEPLGYQLHAEPLPLDETRPEWGRSVYFSVTLEGECRLQDLLSHLYVLIPVLDRDKHYWMAPDEVDKLFRHGEGWLHTHPLREEIGRRYLFRRPSLLREALARLTADDAGAAEEREERQDAEEQAGERALRLNDLRIQAVAQVIRAAQPRKVLDLGCGEGRLLRELLRDAQIEQLTGVDVSIRALEIAQSRLRPERIGNAAAQRVQFLHGALNYRDSRLEGYDAAAVMEVVEHLDPPRLHSFARVLFEHARPGLVALTTPNAEHNVRWPALPAGRFRHRDHRFEWTRAEFRAWSDDVAARFGYAVSYEPIGADDPEVGPPTQMAVFRKAGA